MNESRDTSSYIVTIVNSLWYGEGAVPPMISICKKLLNDCKKTALFL